MYDQLALDDACEEHGEADLRDGATVDAVSVWAFNPRRGDFDELRARRCGADTYELLDGIGGDGVLGAGSVVRCELADGELIVRRQAVATPLA